MHSQRERTLAPYLLYKLWGVLYRACLVGEGGAAWKPCTYSVDPVHVDVVL